MKRITLIILAIAAILAGSVSCQKVNDIDKRLIELEQTVSDLRAQILAGAVITSVDKTDEGCTFTLSNGQTYKVTNGKDGSDGEAIIADVKIEKDFVVLTLKDGETLRISYQNPLSMVTLNIIPDFSDGSVYSHNRSDGAFFLKVAVTPKERLRNFESDSSLFYSADFHTTITKASPDSSYFTVSGQLTSITEEEGYMTISYTLSDAEMDWLDHNDYVVAVSVGSADGSSAVSTPFVPVSSILRGGLGGAAFPGVYLSADYYDEAGYGRMMLFNEDGTAEFYVFFDDNVKDGISVEYDYTLKGTWKEEKIDLGNTGGAFIISNMSLEGSPETIADSIIVIPVENKVYANSTAFGFDEFYRIDADFEDFKGQLESFLPGHLEETLLSKHGPGTADGILIHDDTPIAPEYMRSWMKELPDNIYLRDLSIPGSHDAFSYRCMTDAADQTLTADEQFDWGVRWFDVRYYRIWSGTFRVFPCHGPIPSQDFFHDISADLELLERSVKANPSECVIVRFRCDYFKEYADECAEWIIKNIIDPKKDIYIPCSENMTLGEARGKIVVMSDDTAWPNPYYFSIDNEQDRCDFDDHDKNGHKDFWYISDKTDGFQELIDNDRCVMDKWKPGVKFNNWSINHCSGYLKIFRPVEFAHYVTPSISNVLSRITNKTYGIVPMDFIGRSGCRESRVSVLNVDSFLEAISTILSLGTSKIVIPEWFDIATPQITEQVVKSNDIFKKDPVYYLPGTFTVGKNSDGSDRRVKFSEGNLFYNTKYKSWGFFEHQYDYAKQYDRELLSLFTWGYGSWSSRDFWDALDDDGNLLYKKGKTFSDWGKAITFDKQHTWRTLSEEEWDYLFEKRKIRRNGVEDGRSGAGYTFQWVKYNGVNGIIIYPDEYGGAKYAEGSIIDENSFPENCAFLPAAGYCNFYRSYLEMYSQGDVCYYWSSSSEFRGNYEENQAWFISYDRGNTATSRMSVSRSAGLPVRLVTDVK